MSRTDRKSKRKHRNQPEHVFQPVMVDVKDVAAPGSDAGEALPESKAVPIPVPEPEAAHEISAVITRGLSSDTAEWPFREWPASVGLRLSGYQVVIKRSVLNAIQRHGKTTSDVEVCGVMVGNVYHDDAGSFLEIDACIKGEHSGNSAAQVTFTAETWTHIQAIMEQEHPDRRIVGWYHTHPGFGIFLSDMDLFIHGNFFNLPWQIAFVYDPHSGEEGLFIWQQGKTERVPFYFDEDIEKEIVQKNRMQYR